MRYVVMIAMIGAVTIAAPRAQEPSVAEKQAAEKRAGRGQSEGSEPPVSVESHQECTLFGRGGHRVRAGPRRRQSHRHEECDADFPRRRGADATGTAESRGHGCPDDQYQRSDRRHGLRTRSRHPYGVSQWAHLHDRVRRHGGRFSRTRWAGDDDRGARTRGWRRRGRGPGSGSEGSGRRAGDRRCQSVG